MGYLIAITGKGGTGKTTVAALLVRLLIGRGGRPVLAVDADPNTGLDTALGVAARNTLGRAREESRDLASKGMAAGVSKQRMLEMKTAECLVESGDFDLLAMGRPEGPGCYCYANNVLKEILATLTSQYPFVVLDNEAGLENLSRRIVQKVDLLIFTADPSCQGLATIHRLHGLAREMNIEYRKLAVLVNRLDGEPDPVQMQSLREKTAADRVDWIPEDREIAALAGEGRGLEPISADNPVVRRLDRLLESMDVPGLGRRSRE